MSSMAKSLESRQTPKGVAVYSRDMSAVKSISSALSEKLEEDISTSTNYVVIQQSSVSAIDNVCVASVLDIAMVGADTASVRKAVVKIKQKEPSHPIFLVGEKEALAQVMDDIQVKKAVTGGFALPLSGGGLLMGLNMALEFQPEEDEKVESDDSEFNWRMVVGFFIAAGLIGYWYSQSYESVETPSNQATAVLAEQESLEQANEPADQSLGDEQVVTDNRPAENAVDQISRAKDSSPIKIQSNVVPIVEQESVETPLVEEPTTIVPWTQVPPTQEPVTKNIEETAVDPVAASETVPEVVEESLPLFDSYQEELLGKARAALKKGYIVGPENQSAWHYFRQALEFDALDNRADQRRSLILEELEAEFMLAVGLRKFGRSSSIYRVMKDIDPLNPQLDVMNQRFKERFKKSLN